MADRPVAGLDRSAPRQRVGARHGDSMHRRASAASRHGSSSPPAPLVQVAAPA